MLGAFKRRSGRLTPIIYVSTDLAISGAPRAGDWEAIREAGFRAVLDLRDETLVTEVTPASIERRAYPLADGAAPAVNVLAELADWVREQIHVTGPVLVFCREGRGRSALVACACLMRMGYPVAAAYDLVRRAQPTIALSDEQTRALDELAAVIAAA